MLGGVIAGEEEEEEEELPEGLYRHDLGNHKNTTMTSAVEGHHPDHIDWYFIGRLIRSLRNMIFHYFYTVSTTWQLTWWPGVWLSWLDTCIAKCRLNMINLIRKVEKVTLFNEFTWHLSFSNLPNNLAVHRFTRLNYVATWVTWCLIELAWYLYRKV